MALQYCYECNKEISTKAIICPQCGAPQNPASGLIDKAGGFLKNAFQKGKNHLEAEMNRREIERKIDEDLERVVERKIKEDIGLKVLVDSEYNKFFINSDNKEVQNLMEEMGIERGTKYDWELRVVMKLWDISDRNKEIRDRKKEESKTILSRFRPKE